MINIAALCLVFTTLAAAGVWSPSHIATQDKFAIKQDVIVKEGHRTVEIEYEENDGNTKVKISPHEGRTHSEGDSSPHSAVSLKDKVSQAAESVKGALPDVGHRVSPRELVCDAYGKCKHKIASVVGRTKEVVSEKAHDAVEKVGEVEEGAKRRVGDTGGRAKDAVWEKAELASEKVGEVPEKARQKAEGTAERVKDAILEGTREVAGKVRDTEEAALHKAGESVDRVKDTAKEASDVGKTLTKDVISNLSEQVDSAKGMAKAQVEVGKKNLQEIFRGGGVFARDILGYVLSQGSWASGVGMIQLLGLGMAFGMSIWVTFISSYILAGSLPRQQFALLQSKIYPVYFRAMAYSVGIVLLGQLSSPKNYLHSSKDEGFQGFSLFGALSMILFNLWNLEPRATKVMFERMKLEKEEGRGLDIRQTAEASCGQTPGEDQTRVSTASLPGLTTNSKAISQEKSPEAGATAKAEMARLSEALKRLNSYSSLLNILTLMALAWNLAHMGQLLHVKSDACAD